MVLSFVFGSSAVALKAKRPKMTHKGHTLTLIALNDNMPIITLNNSSIISEVIQ